MSSIDYRYATSDGTGAPDNPPPLIVAIDLISKATIEELTRFLIGSIDLRFDLDGIETHLGARPISIEVGGSVSISEQLFWTIQIESNSGAPDRALEYLDAAIKQTTGELPFCTILEIVGQHPIYAYLDLYLARSLIRFPTDPQPLVSILRGFTRYLRCSDIDHEVPHHRYVDDVLTFLKFNDHDAFVELLLFYLTTQYASDAMSFDHLGAEGILKVAVDHALSRGSGWPLRAHVLELCASVYGSNLELTEDVIAYCRVRRDIGDSHDLINFSGSLSRIRRVHDAKMVGWKSKIRTGFHEYDGRRWRRVDESLWSSGA